jgi:hypothetical protein
MDILVTPAAHESLALPHWLFIFIDLFGSVMYQKGIINNYTPYFNFHFYHTSYWKLMSYECSWKLKVCIFTYTVFCEWRKKHTLCLFWNLSSLIEIFFCRHVVECVITVSGTGIMSDNEAPAQEETKRKRGRPSKTGGEVKVRNC